MSRCRFAAPLGFWTFRAAAMVGQYAHTCTTELVPVYPRNVRRRRACEGKRCPDPVPRWVDRWERICTSDWATGHQWGEIYRDGSPFVKETKLCRGGPTSPPKVRYAVRRRCIVLAEERAYFARAIAQNIVNDTIDGRERCLACEGRGCTDASWSETAPP